MIPEEFLKKEVAALAEARAKDNAALAKRAKKKPPKKKAKPKKP